MSVARLSICVSRAFPRAPGKSRQGSSPHPPHPQCQPDALRHLPERQPQRRAQLGARHPPPRQAALKLLVIARRTQSPAHGLTLWRHIVRVWEPRVAHLLRFQQKWVRSSPRRHPERNDPSFSATPQFGASRRAARFVRPVRFVGVEGSVFLLGVGHSRPTYKRLKQNSPNSFFSLGGREFTPA